LFNLFTVGLFEATRLQIYQVRLEALLLFLNLIITLLESLNQVSKFGYGHFEAMAVIALVVRQVVNFVRLLQEVWNFPRAVVTDKVLDHGASTVSVNIRQI
jgi:hypothetical protein